MTDDFSLEFPFAYGAPSAKALFRAEMQDFQVEEISGLEPSGEGEHCLLHLRKVGENTAWVAGQIAALAGVKASDVGYFGRKDRYAVTSQWFSVYLPGNSDREPDWAQLNSDSVTLLESARHNKKLRLGQHRSNRFVIRLRQVQFDDRSALESRLDKALQDGIPNYFGEQRFGRGGNNLAQAQRLLVERRSIRDRQQRSMALSAARSWLFNQVLALRVEQNCWTQVLDGDPWERASGPLWGRGRPLSSGSTLELEQQALAPWSNWRGGLEHVGLNQERRALLLQPEEASWRWLEEDLELSFTLPPGTFATAVLREIAQLERVGRSDPEAVRQSATVL